MTAHDPAIEAVTLALADNAITEGSDGLHSWRCEHPDIYPGYCTCIPELVADILAAVRPVIEAQALREAAAYLDARPNGSMFTGPVEDGYSGDLGFYGEAQWLRDRADRIEREGQP